MIALDTMYINAIALIVILGIFMGSPLYYEEALIIAMLAKAALHVRQKPRGDTLNHDRLEAIRDRKR